MSIPATCDHCGIVKECFLYHDPFVAEVYNEYTEETYWCEDCFEERKLDI